MCILLLLKPDEGLFNEGKPPSGTNIRLSFEFDKEALFVEGIPPAGINIRFTIFDRNSSSEGAARRVMRAIRRRPLNKPKNKSELRPQLEVSTHQGHTD